MIPKLLFLLSKTTSNAAVLKTFQLFHTTMTQTRCGGVDMALERMNRWKTSIKSTGNVRVYCVKLNRCMQLLRKSAQMFMSSRAYASASMSLHFVRGERMPTISYSGPFCMSQKRVNLLAEWWVLTIQPRHVGGGGVEEGGACKLRRCVACKLIIKSCLNMLDLIPQGGIAKINIFLQ